MLINYFANVSRFVHIDKDQCLSYMDKSSEQSLLM